jgi:hypothetical protein
MRGRWLHRGAFLASLILAPSTLAAQEPLPTSCDSVADFHQLDFWIGEWEVKVAGQTVGTNRIEKVLNGCAVTESWRDAAGGEGRSLFYYDHLTDVWKQVWVTQNATSPGGLKEKTLVEVLGNGSLRFQGVIRLADGRSYLDRTTLSPLDGGSVGQRIETSTDGGATWQMRFDAVYVRVTR